MKIDERGNKVWDKTYGGSNDDIFYSLAYIPKEGYLLSGKSNSSVSGDKTQNSVNSYDGWVMRVDLSGKVLWDRTYSSNHSFYISSILVDGDSFVLGGRAKAEGDYLIFRVNKEGEIVWSQLYGGDSREEFKHLIKSPNNGFLLVGDSYSNISRDKSQSRRGARDYWIISISEDIINPNQIKGQVFRDENINCKLDKGEVSIQGWTIEARSEKITYSTLTDSVGNYIFDVNADTYEISVIPPPNFQVHNVCSKTNTITFEDLGQEVKDINFAVNATPCAVLNVDVSSNRRLRCFQGQTTITYQNEGITSAEDTYIEVQIPEFTIPITSDIPWTSYDESTRLMTFELGTLAAGDFGQIILTDSIACVDEAFNQSQCTEARIYPKNTCNPPDPNWSGADLQVKGNCFVLFDPLAQFTINNQGTGDMTASTAYRLYADSSLIYEGTVQLTAGDDFNLEVPTGGKSIRIEVDQVPFHPENTQVSTSVEGCGQKATQVISKSAALDFPQNDDNFDFEVSCLPVVGSHDPNDKLVSPAGFTDQHYVAPGTKMEYTIRFQNTGTFMAFTVKVVDTLSADLDVATFEMMSASHDYSLDLQTTTDGQNILTWTFNNINLPDSTSNEPESHGYIKFKINPQEDLALGTQVENFADIFFDFNDPIRTNTTLTTFDNYVFPEPATPVDPCTFVSTAKINNDLEITLCDTEALPKLIAENPRAGKGKWTIIQGNATIDHPNKPEISISNLSLGEHILRWQISPEICADNYQDIKITIKATPAQPVISNPSDYILQSSVTGDRYNWYLDGVLLDHHERNIEAANTGDYQVEVSNNGCISGLSTIYRVTGCSFLSPASVGSPLSICDSEAQLAATLPEIGTGVWTLIQGTGEIITPTDATSMVRGLSIGENVFRWQISGDICATNYQDFRITVKPTPNQPIIDNPGIDVLESSVEGDHYRWYLDGVLMVDQTTRSFRALESGVYQVEVIQAGCVSQLSTEFILEVTSLEATLIETYGFKIHPNPTDGELEIQLEKLVNQIIQVQVRGEQGNLLYTKEFKSNQGVSLKEKLDLSTLPSGIYLLEVRLKEGTITKKIIIQ